MKGFLRRVGPLLMRVAMLTFPARFRRRYGEEPDAVFRDRLDHALSERGVVSVMGFIAVNVIDTVLSGFRTRSEEVRISSRRRYALTPPSLVTAVRTLARRPRFFLLLAGPLGLSLGTVTAAFSIAHAVLFRPLPFPDSERIYLLGTRAAGSEVVRGISLANCADLRAALTTVRSAHCLMGGGGVLETSEGPVRVGVLRSSEGTLATFGVSIMAGRGFVASDHRVDGPVLLGARAWRTYFGGDPDIVGQPIRYNDQVRVVVGVVGPDARLPSPLRWGSESAEIELWIPLQLTVGADDVTRAFGFARAVVVLPDGGTPESVTAEIDAVGAGLVEAYPEANTRGGQPKRWGVTSLRRATAASGKQGVWLLVSAALVLLAIAIANSGHLLLLRAAQQSRDVALRMALGASRLRVAMEIVMESTIICFAAGLFGVLIATWTIGAFVGLAPDNVPRLHEVRISGVLLAGGMGLALASTLVVGGVPAIFVARQALYERLRGRSTGDRSEARARHVLLGAQTALALMLLVNAGLLLGSLGKLLTVDRGFASHDLWAMRVGLPNAITSDDHQTLATFLQIREGVAALPGVRRASGSVFLLGESAPMSVRVHIDGDDRGAQLAHTVLPEFFRTIGIPVGEGRVFTPADHRLDAPRVVILSRALAQSLFPDGNAVGSRLTLDTDQESAWMVVGVARDTRSGFRASEPEPVMYLPFGRWAWIGSMMIMARLEPGTDAGFHLRLQNVVRQTDDRIPAVSPFRVDDFLVESAGEPRFYAWLFSSFSGIALVLAAVGLYATLSFTVTRRTREVAIRRALGAENRQLLEPLVRHAVVVTALGCAVGIGLSVASGRLLEGLLFELEPGNPATVVIASGVLLLVAAISAFVPARRATAADPMLTLRED